MSASVWRRNSLGKIGIFSNGVNKPKEAFGHGTKFVNISDVFLPSLEIRDLDKVEISDNEKSFYSLKKDDVLFVRSSVKPDGVGYNTIFEDSNEEVVFCGFVIRFRKSSYEIDAHFLNFLLRSSEYRTQIISFSTVSANTNINQVSLKRIEIEYPQDIEEQKHIADILSTCDTVIQNTQKTIDKYKAIKQGMMQDLFTRGLTQDGKLRPSYKEAPELYKESELGMIPKEWEVDCIENLTAYVDYRGKTPIKIESGIQLVTAKNIKDGFIDYNISKEFIAKEDYNSVMSRGLPKLGDVLFTTEAPVGNVAQINDENVALAQRVIKFRGKETSMDNTFLLYSFLSEYFRRILLSESTGSTAQGIKGSRLHKLLLKYPSIPEQKKINEKLSSIDSTIQKEEAILEKYKNIKTGLMARLLTPPEDAEIIDEIGETL